MANRYWVGGDGNWSQANLHWSDSSGGAPSASFLPTSADNVIFDANSNTGTSAFTVCVDSIAQGNCLDFSTSSLDGVMTLQLDSILNVYGNFTLPATNFATLTGTSGLVFPSTSGSYTITTNGVDLGARTVQFSNAGATWTLGSALTATGGAINVLGGTFNTGNYNITSNSVNTSGAITRSISLGSSTITLSGTSGWPFTAVTGLTFNAGTSSIVMTAVSPTFTGAGLTYYNVEFSGGAGTKTINGANTFSGQFKVSNTATSTITFGANQTFTGDALIQATTVTVTGSGFSHSGTFEFASAAHGTKSIGASQTFQNLKITCPSVDGTTSASIGSITVSGTLTTTDGGSAARRIQIIGTSSTQRTLTVGTNSLINTDFRDIAAAGTASWTFGLGYGDLGGNSGITFNTSTLYWIGGTGSWSDGTKWSTSTGGSAANAVPGPQNSVIFDANSNVGTGSFTVTATPNSYCNDFSTGGAGGALDGAMTLSLGATATLNVYGSLTLPSTNFTWSGTSGAVLNFNATTTGKTVTTNGVTLTNMSVVFNGVGGEWTLGSAFSTTTNGITVTAGSFVTGNFNITTIAFATTSNSLVRSVALGSSTLTLSGSSPVQIGATTTNLTFNAGTSTITCSAASPTFAGAGLTFYNVNFTSAASGSTTITGANTFNNLNQTSRSAAGIRQVIIQANQTVNGTLTLGAANQGNRRILVYANNIPANVAPGTTYTITAATVATLSDVNFQGITAAGASAPWSGTRLGDAGSNTNITFAAGTNKYWNLAAGGNWSATAWATSSGGAVSDNNFPLPQDTAIIENTGLNTSATITMDTNWQVGTVTAATRTNAWTLAGANTIYIYGDFTLNSTATTSYTGGLYFSKVSGTQTLTTNGVSIAGSLGVSSGGTVRLNGNATFTSTSPTTFIGGTLDLTNGGAGNYTLSCYIFNSINTNTRSITFGTGNITLTGNNATIWATGTATGFTYTGIPSIISNYSGSTGTRTFSFHNTTGGTETNALNLSVTAGSDAITFVNGCQFKNISFSSYTGSALLGSGTFIVYGDYTLASGMTINASSGNQLFYATSGTQNIQTNGLSLGATQSIAFGNTATPTGVATYKLLGNVTLTGTRTFTLNNGTLDLNTFTATGYSFLSNVSSTRAIAFNSGSISVNGNNGTVVSMNTATNFSYTGTPTINATYSGAIGQRAIGFGSTAGATESNVLNINVTAGTDYVAFFSGSSVKNLSFTGFSGVLTATNRSVYGNLTFGSGMTTVVSASAATTMSATSGTQTITSNGVSFNQNLTINSPGATSSLADALVLGSTNTLTLTQGTLTTNNYNVTTGLFASAVAGTRTLNMGSSTFTTTGSGTVWNVANSAGLTLSAGTSKIVVDAANGTAGTTTTVYTFNGDGLTYYDLEFGNNAVGLISFAMNGTNTFRNVTGTCAASVIGRGSFNVNDDLTLTGALSVQGADYTKRIAFFGRESAATYITAASATLAYLDIRGVNALGATIPWSGTNLGDCGRNTNITFGAPKTVYWSQPAGGNWSDVAWATTSGGVPSAANFPLAQDTAVIDNAGINASTSLVIDGSWNTGAFDASTLTNAITLDCSTLGGTWNLYGNVTFSSSMSTLGAAANAIAMTFNGTSQTFDSAGINLNMLISKSGASTRTLTLLNNINSTLAGLSGTQYGFRLNGGVLDLNGYNITAFAVQVTATTTRELQFNGGVINVNGNGMNVWQGADLTGFTLTGTPTVNLTYAGSTGTRTIENGSTAGLVESNAVSFNITAGTDTIATTASGLLGGCRNLNYTGFSGVGDLFGGGYIYGNLTLGAGMTLSASSLTTTFASTSGIKNITTNGVTIPRALNFNGIGGTWSMQDALTVFPYSITLTAGTLTTNGYTLSCPKLAFAGSDTKVINLGASSVVLTLTGTSQTAWDESTAPTNLTVNAGTSTIYMSANATGASQQFYSGGHTFYNLVFTTITPSTWIVRGSNTFNSISNTAQPATLSFVAGTTQTVNSFGLSGTSGNLLTLNSLTPGSQWYLVKNTGTKVLVSNCSIQDSNASPAGYWFAPTSQGNVDAGNNTGWNFAASGSSNGFFLLM